MCSGYGIIFGKYVKCGVYVIIDNSVDPGVDISFGAISCRFFMVKTRYWLYGFFKWALWDIYRCKA